MYSVIWFVSKWDHKFVVFDLLRVNFLWHTLHMAVVIFLPSKPVSPFFSKYLQTAEAPLLALALVLVLATK